MNFDSLANRFRRLIIRNRSWIWNWRYVYEYTIEANGSRSLSQTLTKKDLSQRFKKLKLDSLEKERVITFLLDGF